MARKDKSAAPGEMLSGQPLGELSGSGAEDNQAASKKNVKTPSQKTKKPNIFKRIFRYFKEMWSELKKVTWPTFPKVMKQTGVVLVVVLIFLLILLGIDAALSALLRLLVS